MSPHVRLGLCLLQQLALMQVLRELARVLRVSGRGEPPGWDGATISQRFDNYHRELLAIRGSFTAEDLSQLRICRAVFLRRMMASASARLGGWEDSVSLEDAPVSRLFEWLSHDFERLELSALEEGMTMRETAFYLQIVGIREV